MLSFDDDLPLVQADAAQLERAFVNLLENARRYSGGHPVKVRARVVGGRMIIRVIDRGPGMSARSSRGSSSPSSAASRPASTPARGSASRSSAASSRPTAADVHAESLPGQGTVFVVELPLAEQPAPAASRAPVSTARSSSATTSCRSCAR